MAPKSLPALPMPPPPASTLKSCFGRMAARAPIAAFWTILQPSKASPPVPASTGAMPARSPLA